MRANDTCEGDVMVELDYTKFDGLLPAVVQDWESGDVLMVAFMNEEAFKLTVETKKATYFSRSRGKLWVKGESSGNEQLVKEIRIDCDADTVLLKVVQKGGAACHLGYKSCFFRKVDGEDLVVTGEPLFDPDEVYKK
nr:phosphoribosyl-AMP cyclohydrolase [Desulfoluna spongiiphila]